MANEPYVKINYTERFIEFKKGNQNFAKIMHGGKCIYNFLDSICAKYPYVIDLLDEYDNVADIVCNYPSLCENQKYLIGALNNNSLLKRALNEQNYVNDSLVLKLTPFGLSEGIWTEEINNVDFDLFSSYEIDENGIILFNGGYGAISEIPGVTTTPSGSTIEVVFKMTNTRSDNRYSIFTTTGNGGIGLILYDGKFMVCSEGAGGNPIYNAQQPVLNELCCAGGNSNLFIMNTEHIATTGSDFWGGGINGLRIANNRSSFIGKIAEIRLHSRILSPGELINNQKLDLDSYGSIM